MARVIKALGHGGQIYVEQEFHWSRETITKGKHELESGLNTMIFMMKPLLLLGYFYLIIVKPIYM